MKQYSCDEKYVFIPCYKCNKMKKKSCSASKNVIEINNKKQVTHSKTNPRPGQYLAHAHSHITRAAEAMDSCFGLVRLHQHSIAVGKQ